MSLHNIVFRTCSHWWWNARFDYVTVWVVKIIHISAVEHVTGWWRYINELLLLFTLQYCIERSFKLRRPLIVTCLDYSKAFDSKKRKHIIETLIHYKVHYKIIDIVANIYKDDYTEIQFGVIRKKIEITTGINQGCTGSTILFVMVTYMIMAELDKRGKGYNDEHISQNHYSLLMMH